MWTLEPHPTTHTEGADGMKKLWHEKAPLPSTPNKIKKSYQLKKKKPLYSVGLRCHELLTAGNMDFKCTILITWL